MKTTFLLHGTGGSNKDYYWFAYAKKYLESKGYKVWWPQLPNTEKPELYETEDYICDYWPGIDEETIIIGHSSACPVILDILQWLKIKVDKVILVSGFYKSIDDEGFSELMLPKKNFDYEKIAKHANEIILINSDNDHEGIHKAVKQLRELIPNIAYNEFNNYGHFTSDSMKSTEFPELLEAVL